MPSRKRSVLFCTFTPRGSYTVEAALTVPLFILVIGGLLWFFLIQGVQTTIQGSLQKVGGQVSSLYYLTELSQDENKALLAENDPDSIVPQVLSYGLTNLLFRSLVLENLPADWEGEKLIRNGRSGLSFANTYYDAREEKIYLIVQYEVEVPFLSLLPLRFSLFQKTSHRVWTGRAVTVKSSEDLVYVTETGTAYHRALDCSAIHLSIRQVPRSSIADLRNESGGKYAPCELCGEQSSEQVYITNYGERYHTSRNCSGIKRTVRSIPISEIGERTPCKKCTERE